MTDLQKTDPASYNNLIDQNKGLVTQYAQISGVDLSDAQLTSLATQAAIGQWNTQEIQQHTQQAYDATGTPYGTTNQGDAATFMQTIQNVAGQYLQTADSS